MKYKKLLLASVIIGLFYGFSAKAVVCSVCTVAVSASVGLCRWLGVDDSISGLWIGGLVATIITWTIQWLDKKNIRFIGRKIMIVISYYLFIFSPLFFTGILGNPRNQIWGVDKLLFGVVVGNILFMLGGWLYRYLKARNNDRAYFPFQKAVMPIIPLIIMSFIFYYFICS